ncbi:MAG: hypothetical protein V3T17_17295 [Pseudomonadales bacterium]
MSFFSTLLKGGDLVGAVGKSLDELFTSDEERLEQQRELLKAQRQYNYKEAQLTAQQNTAQTQVNKEAARSGIRRL